MAQKPRSKALSCAAKSYSLLEKRLPKSKLGVKVPWLPGSGLYRPWTSGSALYWAQAHTSPEKREFWKTNTGHVPLTYAADLYLQDSMRQDAHPKVQSDCTSKEETVSHPTSCSFVSLP